MGDETPKINIPYTCHHCSKEFDLLPDKDIYERINRPIPTAVRIKCPHCHEIFAVNTKTKEVISEG